MTPAADQVMVAEDAAACPTPFEQSVCIGRLVERERCRDAVGKHSAVQECGEPGELHAISPRLLNNHRGTA